MAELSTADLSTAELSIDWIVVRDDQRTVFARNCSSWDQLTILCALSNDPRSWEELSIAWSRFRSEPLEQWTWEALDETTLPPAGWLWLDLEHQQFAFLDSEPADVDRLTPGAYGNRRTNDKNYVWLNIPPWWRRLQATELSEVMELNRLSSAEWTPPLDYREVLYGRELASEVVRQVLALQWPTTPPGAAKEGRSLRARNRLRKLKSLSRTKVRRIEKLIKRVHVIWLMTPRPSLNGRMPREFLHAYREWKDRELDYRRAQWSRTRVAPPGVPRDSQHFRYGPMGTGEVVMYFDLVRDLILAAWRWVDDDPRISAAKLTEDLLLYIQGYLASPDQNAGGSDSVRDIIDEERTLVPRLASGEPIDCDCPLCRLQANDELFGPTFTVNDGYHLELEDEFAFSLESDRATWEGMRLTDEERNYPHGLLDDVSRPRLGQQLSWPDEDQQEQNEQGIWSSSHVSSEPAPPELSLFAIGARLAELIELLKLRNAPRNIIDELNETFDDMSKVIRDWIVDRKTGNTPDEPDAMSQVVERMVVRLEASALAVPEITSQSADLQSLVHEWQRQLMAQ